MTPMPLDHAVARSTGESLRTVRRLGFQGRKSAVMEPEDLTLALDCPFCGRTCALPLDATSQLAECDRCDVVFDVQPGDVFATEVA